MNFYIIIPAHNEVKYIAKTLESLTKQTLLPKKVVVVNDNSTDGTQYIVEGFESKFSWISLLNSTSTSQHLPGSKVIDAFYKGFKQLDEHYDIICKFDADIILPNNYLEKIASLFNSDKTIGIAGGLAYIKKDHTWIYENVANKNHVRGPFKAYRKACFKQIGGLKPSIGWDTVDTLLAKYNNWQVVTDQTLHVKHLKPTGKTYNTAAKYLQGEALYKMRYGFCITLISALKLALKKRSFYVFKNYIIGYFQAKFNRLEFLVSKKEGKFIRDLRWRGVLGKFNLK